MFYYSIARNYQFHLFIFVLPASFTKAVWNPIQTPVLPNLILRFCNGTLLPYEY